MATITPFLKLYKPVANELGWDDNMNANLDTIDGYINEFLHMPGFVGVWTNAHNYSVGVVTLDIELGQFFDCKVTHVSAPTGTFAADRALHPTFWALGANHAQDSATAAANSAAAAANSASAATTSLNQFKQTYYGAFSAVPLVDPLGGARTAGDLYFNTTTQRLNVFVTTPAAAWVELTTSVPDAPAVTPASTAFLRTAGHLWVEGVPSAGGTFSGDVLVSGRLTQGMVVQPLSTVGVFSPYVMARDILAVNLYLTPTPAPGVFRYMVPVSAAQGAFLMACNTTGGVRQTTFYTTLTNEVSTQSGVATLSPMMRLESSNSVVIFGNAFKPGGGVWGDSSDVRIKNIVGPYPHGLHELLEMLPQMFTYKGNDYSIGTDGQPGDPLHPDTTTQYIGLIAQECEEYMPELVTQTTCFIDGVLQTDVRQLNATGIIYALINAVAELDKRPNTKDVVGTATSDPIGIYTGDAVDGQSGMIVIETGGASGNGKSGNVVLATGLTEGSGASGNVSIYTNGAEGTGATGSVGLSTGESDAASSGNITLFTGLAANASSGNLQLQTGSGKSSGVLTLTTSNATAGSSGNILITTGIGTTASGPILLRTGDATTGTVGADITIQSGKGTTSPGKINIGSAPQNALTIQNGGATTAATSISTNTGGLQFNTTKLGFMAATPIVKPTVTGAKGSNAALASLISALVNYGLIIDTTTA